MATRSVILLDDERTLAHATWGHHPETRERVTALCGRLRAGPLAPALLEERSRPAGHESLLAVHDEDYLLRFEEAALSGREWFDHRDNQIGEGSFEAALVSAGAGPAAIDLIESGRAPLAFCAVRPPGHHAERSHALGFCFFNNAAVAVRHWQRAHGRRRVLVFDFDAHHGNGIQHAFESDPDVLYVSLHEHPTFSFPGTGYAEERGTGAGEGATVNLPLLPGARDAEALEALEERVEPAVREFCPEAIVVAAGFDGHVLDDMSGLAYSTQLFARFGGAVARWAAEHAGGRALTILEGGYHLDALCDSAEQYLLGLAREGAGAEVRAGEPEETVSRRPPRRGPEPACTRRSAADRRGPCT